MVISQDSEPSSFQFLITHAVSGSLSWLQVRSDIGCEGISLKVSVTIAPGYLAGRAGFVTGLVSWYHHWKFCPVIEDGKVKIPYPRLGCGGARL